MMVAVVDFPPKEILIFLKQLGPGYPPPYCYTAKVRPRKSHWGKRGYGRECSKRQ